MVYHGARQPAFADRGGIKRVQPAMARPEPKAGIAGAPPALRAVPDSPIPAIPSFLSPPAATRRGSASVLPATLDARLIFRPRLASRAPSSSAPGERKRLFPGPDRPQPPGIRPARSWLPIFCSRTAQRPSRAGPRPMSCPKRCDGSCCAGHSGNAALARNSQRPGSRFLPHMIFPSSRRCPPRHGRQAAVSPRLPPHLKPKSDIPRLEDVRAAIVLDRIPLGGKQLPGAGFHLRKYVPHLCHIGGRGDLRIAGSFQHLWELRSSVLIVQPIGFPSVIGSIL